MIDKIKTLDKKIAELRIDSTDMSQRILDIEFEVRESDDYLILNKSDKKEMIALNLKQPKQDFKVLNVELKNLEDERSTLKKSWYSLNKMRLPTALEGLRF
jgi:hypothetical protein